MKSINTSFAKDGNPLQERGEVSAGRSVSYEFWLLKQAQ
ncbi:hypothetical protein QFZ51_005962 [Chitinophaga sp. W3I9]